MLINVLKEVNSDTFGETHGTLAERLMRWITNPFPYGAKVQILQVPNFLLVCRLN